MIVNKSMFPLQTGFSVISGMQEKFAQLQVQLGTGQKAQTLSEMGRDLPVSLSVRARLSTISGYSGNIETVAMRMSFIDNALTRFDKIEGEARNSAVQGQYGTNNVNMATISGLSKARLDEMVTLLNSDIAGRYLFGGSVTDKAPLPTTPELMDGVGGRAGYKTIVTERQMADLGQEGLGRLETTLATGAATDPASVTLSEDGDHPFGFKLSTVSSIGANIAVDDDFDVSPAQVEFTFPAPPDAVAAGDSITLGFTLPDGTETQITLKAVAEGSSNPAINEFVIGADASETATAFNTALRNTLTQSGESELRAASTFAASQNFFNAAGEPALRVAGNDPYNATALRLATPSDTVQWYSGESAAVSAASKGRLGMEAEGASVSLTENVPVSPKHGFKITSGSSTTSSGGIAAVHSPGVPSSLDVTFNANTEANDAVTFTLTEPNGKQRQITLTAVDGRAGANQFSIGDTPEETAANFNAALNRSVTQAAADAEGNPRQSVSAVIEDSGRANYGMHANENGFLRIMRSMAAMSVETYPEITNASDPNAADLRPAKLRFDAMARRQQLDLSETHNSERGSIELITMEMGIAKAATKSASERHTSYKAQLDNLLSDVETVSKEDVAMEILALQTRLTASYQVTSMVSQLSLVNYL